MNLKAGNDLLQRYLKNECTSEEKKLVEDWYGRLLETGDLQLTTEEKAGVKNRIEKNILQQISEEGVDAGGIVYKGRFNWRKVWWAAAVFVVLIGAGFLFFTDRSATNTELAENKKSTDVKAPESNRAMITLANGEKVYIDSALSGQLVLQGNMKIVKLPTGEITYVLDENSIAEAISYNTVSNPRGSKVLSMMLADGTKFWLNAGSSLTYPVVFTGDVRKVEITGEAYFEVAHNDKMPFVVTKGETEIKVLGTHFNVNAYDDEKELRVTLLEGAVQVRNGSEGLLLKPGQQAEVEGSVKLVDGVDIDLVMAWKNGMFAFHDASLQEVMRQIARWYDVKVLYEGTIPEHSFRGKIQRDNNLSVVLQVLAEANIHYKINGNEIIVTK
jgi:transmembrane sensor